MLITELLTVVLSLGTLHFSNKIFRQILADESFNMHIFNQLDFARKIDFEKNKILNNVQYIFSIVFLIILRIILPFNSFVFFTWFHLYAIVQSFLITTQHQLKKIDKVVSVIFLVVYYCVKSTHLENLILYSMMQLTTLFKIDKQLFGKNNYLKKFQKLFLRIDSVLFFVFWLFSIVRFYTTPSFVDSVFIPITFYMNLQQLSPLNNKKII